MTNVTDGMPELKYEKKPVSQEQLQHEYDYFLAQQLLESMLKKDLITVDEFNKITTLNRKSFSPALAQIMPENR
jgi:flagellin-specific chaperone FliS